MTRRQPLFFRTTFFLIVALSCAPGHAQNAVDPISFSKDIRPVFAANCFACHGPDEDAREGGLGLHQRELALAELDSGENGIVPGDARSSEVFRRITSEDLYERMPPEDSGHTLSPAQIEKIRQWIDEGAKYDSHWSYRPLARPPVPDVSNEAWPNSPIDVFVLARLERAELRPEQEATREKLLRRVSLDLIGLPPSPEQVRDFVNDDRPEAYERIVDQLLQSPQYGEHWASMWLDLARYADSQGYAQDELRTIWPYRDWVIRAFNGDMPFDQFTIEQLAGDLLPNPTTDQLVATGFHRNTMTNTEGGTDDAEFRYAAVIDRVNTTAQVWLGTTLGCAQCHTHKFDPIEHREYYEFLAFFNQTADNDQPDNRPTLPVLSESFQRRTALFQAEIERLSQVDASDPNALIAAEGRLAELKKQLGAMSLPRTPIMRELPPDKARQTHVAIGGAYTNPGEVVSARLPNALSAAPDAATDRLGLARWLVSDQNPLTARVAVNRHWEQFFGRGLVETSEDFGSQGTPPTHPQLLDWLAVEFMQNGWSMKQLCKTIVMSKTYRQSSRATEEKLSRDRWNLLISRGPRHRLSAEQLRDYALCVSGLLSNKMYGPPVRPPQPKTGLKAAFGGSLDWEPSAGEDRYRRAVYTLWRRTNPYPSFMAMDATDRKTCTVRRIRTNTPVAAFVTLNDPAFVEAAQHLARDFANGAEVSIDQKVVSSFERVVCRPPTDEEQVEILGLFRALLAEYAEDSAAATLMAGVDDQVANVDELAAWTVVCNVLLNLDEVLTKN